MAPNVMAVTSDELERRRAAILEDLKVTRDDLRARAESYTLTGEEWSAVTELEEIEFLLGE